MIFFNPDKFHQRIAEAQAAQFSGWDFAWLKGRMVQQEPPWDYSVIVKSHFKNVYSLLDMGTGGGELLSELAPLPPDTHATESFQPNLEIAQKRLSPLAVTVHPFEKDDELPFDDAYFDLVINRHDSFDLDEVFRLLKPGGHFITQQVGGLDNLELNQTLEIDLSLPFFDWGMESVLTKLYEREWLVEMAEKTPLKTTFLDIGAVFYYLKAIPWQIEGFSLESHFEGLLRVHNIIERQGEFVTTAHRFIIEAKKRETTL